jgi:hypothetical protein
MDTERVRAAQDRIGIAPFRERRDFVRMTLERSERRMQGHMSMSGKHQPSRKVDYFLK